MGVKIAGLYTPTPGLSVTTQNIGRADYLSDVSLFPKEDVLTKEIETWRGFIDKLPSDEDKAILTKLLNNCYKYSLAINNHAQEHPFHQSL